MNNLSYRTRFFKALVLVCVLASCVAAGASGVTEKDWRAKQEIWWNDAQLVKAAIVGYVRFLNTNPELQTKENPQWEIMSLVLVLDGRNDANTLKTLVSLAPYNIGVSGSEIYDCVVKRKGQKILPSLQVALASRQNECTKSMGSYTNTCLKSADYVSRLQGAINAIKSNQSCTIEK